MRSRSRGVLRRDELLDLQRSSGGDPGERGSGLLLSLPFWRLQEPGARPWPGEPLLLFACILLLACIVVTYEQRILIDTKDTSELELQENEYMFLRHSGERVELLPLSRL